MNPPSTESDPMTTMVAKTGVPLYLRSSEFYKSLQDDDDAIPVPTNCLKADNRVNSNEDLKSLLMTLRFWVASPVTESLLWYVVHHSVESWEVLAEFYQDMPVLKQIKEVASAPAHERLAKAIHAGVFEIVECCCKMHMVWPANATTTAAQFGHVDILQFAHQSGCNPSVDACIKATKHGHLDCLKYLLDNDCPMNEKAILAALHGDHFECFKYLHEQGCPWIAGLSERNVYGQVKRNICTDAAGCGRLEFLIYAHTQGVPLQSELYGAATKAHSMACVEYAHQQGCLFTGFAYHDAIHCNFLPMVQFLHENGHPFQEGLCDIAMYGNQRPGIVRYLLEHGAPFDEATMQTAIQIGEVEVVMFLLRHGCAPHEDLYTLPTEYDLLQVLHCYVEVGLPWDAVDDALEHVVEAGFLECLKLMIEHGCPWDPKTTCYAAQRGHLHILKYAHEHGCPWAPDTCLVAAQNDNFECLKYAHLHGCAIPSNMCDVIIGGCIECFMYAHQNGGGVLSPSWRSLAMRYGQTELLQYFDEQGV